ncbi:SMI1/KNR4 family protein [Radiobacillus sp. PE A8.2]|uniref:SMI1/KNR4 family protein n=1 Tax=Radiobacillus sp. PE A8.2 TaxID=3380349 RepID=UPI003890A8F0
MNMDEFITQFHKRYPEVDRFNVATDDMVKRYEKKLGYRLPFSFVEFLKKFSNGIFLLDYEPIGGVSEDSPCSDIQNVNTILPNIPDEVFIVETNEHIASSRLISFTMFDAGDHSGNHWVFLCEDGVSDYRVGFVSQSSLKIVKVLNSFEEWLTILWKNDDEDVPASPVFNILFPSYEKRDNILFD